MDADELALILCEIRERTAGDPEAYAEAVDVLAEMLSEGDLDEEDGGADGPG